jgi:cytochrome c peroxidase
MSGSCASPPPGERDFFHHGRFATLSDVVDHYNSIFGLVLTDPEKTDPIEYLKSL